MTDEQTLRSASAALRMVCASLPHLAGLAHLVNLSIDRRIDTAGVFASGRLIVNPDWFGELAFPDQVFVMAHELLHLAFQSHERSAGSDHARFNAAHDCIINDVLVEALGRPVPAGGLEWCGARDMSAEQIMRQCYWPPGHSDPSWRGPAKRKTALGDALSKAGLNPPQKESRAASDGPDLLSDETERKWFPGVNGAQQAHERLRIKVAATKSDSLAALEKAMSRLDAPAGESGLEERAIEALHTLYRPPWELALQQWMEAVAPAGRSYARPSRRGADRRDVVLAGRKREGWILHIVLDTSGSMSSDLSHVLGVIASFCEAANVNAAHILQCDEDVTRDEFVTPEELSTFTIAGFGGSDMSGGLLRLAEDPEVEVAMVITDGYINYPPDPMPYHVLWALTEANRDFDPPYGEVLQIG